MSRLLKSITLAMLLFFAMDGAAADNSITLNLNQESSDSEHDDEDVKTKGPRIYAYADKMYHRFR